MPWKERYTVSDEIGLKDHEVRWPDGQRCAFTIVVDLNVASGPEGIGPDDLSSSYAELGATEGLATVRRSLEQRGLKATFVVPAVIAEIMPDAVKAIAAAGHDIAAGGFKGEDVSGLPREEEQARLALTTEILTRVAGRRPTGWYGLPRQRDPFAVGTVSPNTIDLLIDAGYRYFGNGLADDIPHYWVSDFERRRALLAMPYYYHYDDQWFAMFPVKGSGLETTDMLARNWRWELDAQYKRGRCFSMTLHPRLVWSNRQQLVDAFLDHALGLPGLWNPTVSQCAEYWLEAYPASTTLKLEPSIWKDYPDSLS